MIRLVDEDAHIAVPALVRFGHRGRLAMSGPFGDFAGYAVARDDAQKWVGDEHVLQRNFDVLANTG